MELPRIPKKVVRTDLRTGKRMEHIYTEEEQQIIIKRLAEGKTRQEIDKELGIKWPNEEEEDE